MRVHYFDQLTDEWFSARRGIPSASEFGKIVTSTGKVSAQARGYVYKLAAEAVTDESNEREPNEWMLRGIEMEAEARALYEFETGADVYEVGGIENKGCWCSPDGLVEGSELGGLEIKCPAPHTHVGYLVNGKLPTDYFAQVQGSLWITGLPWWDFMSYHPDMRPLIIRVTPDAKYHQALDAEIPKVLAELAKTIGIVQQDSMRAAA